MSLLTYEKAITYRECDDKTNIGPHYKFFDGGSEDLCANDLRVCPGCGLVLEMYELCPLGCHEKDFYFQENICKDSKHYMRRCFHIADYC